MTNKEVTIARLTTLLITRMDYKVRETINNSTAESSLLVGLLFRSTVSTLSQEYRKTFKENREELGISEEDIDAIVDEAIRVILNTYEGRDY